MSYPFGNCVLDHVSVQVGDTEADLSLAVRLFAFMGWQVDFSRGAPTWDTGRSVFVCRTDSPVAIQLTVESDPPATLTDASHVGLRVFNSAAATQAVLSWAQREGLVSRYEKVAPAKYLVYVHKFVIEFLW